MRTYFLRSLGRVLASVAVALLPVALAAQAGPAAKGAANDSPSKWDIFAGYSYLAPNGTVAGNPPFNAVNYAAIASVSRYFNNYVGVTAEGDEHILLPERQSHTTTQPGNDFSGGSAGLIFRFPSENITPFVHGLVGAEQVGSWALPERWGVVLTAGGGMDYETPWFNHHLAIRLFQADYQYTHEDFAPGARGNFNAARLSAGIVIHAGSIAPPAPITLACSASPEIIFPGDPITLTASAGGLNPKDHVIYTWSGTGVTGSDTNPKIDTSSLAPGEYTVTGTVKEGKPGKEGLKPWETATCTAGITVKAFEPPTISCSVSPSTIKPGDAATITAVGVSPQNRPLTYSYTASAGTITGTGTTADYSSAGAPTGAVGITCNVSDDKGHTASSPTSLTITAPYVPPAPKTQALCSISFANDKKRPMRVDNEAKACLDQVALDLKQQADAKAVVVGESDADENAKTAKEQKYAAKHKHATVDQFAAQRAVNAKDYLVTEQGIDASRVSVATSPTDGQTVENYLVPAGATFSSDVTGTTPVDETAVKPQVRKPLPERHPTKKTAQ